MNLSSEQKLGVLGLDPRTHLVGMIAAGAATMVIVDLRLIIAAQVIAAVYLVLNGRSRLCLTCAMWFVVFFALGFLPLAGIYGSFILQVLHTMPVFTIGCALFTQSPSAIMCALKRMHAPKGFVVGACMVFRFASLLSFEVKSILRGIRMRSVFPRGIDVALHPALAYECVYVPLVMRSLRLSSELAASAQLRGIEIDGNRTSIHHVGFSAADAASAIVLVALYAALVALDVAL